MKVTIIGTGYVGLVSAAVLAHIGHNVTCIDINKEKVAELNAGKCPIFEKDLPELLQQNRDRLIFTEQHEDAYSDAEIIIIAVGTPEREDGSANLDYVFNAADDICENINTDCIVVVKSTVPIGTNDNISQRFSQRCSSNIKVEVVSNPEFLSQGSAVKDMIHAHRIVVGCESKNARDKMECLYKPLNQPIVFTDRRSAEMIKYASNDFLALKISYINEIANMCEYLGANIEDVAKGMGMDPRIGDKFLQAGIGYGGSCFPKDTKALHWLAMQHDYELKTIKAAIDVNEHQRLRLLDKAEAYLGSFENRTITILGLSFKPGTDDLREAPSKTLIPILLERGAKIKAWDPCSVDNFKTTVNQYSENIIYCEKPEQALENSDLCLILTEWPEIKALPENAFYKMTLPIIIDGRNCFNLEDMQDKLIIYESIGRKTVGEFRYNK